MKTENFIVRKLDGTIIPSKDIWMIQFRNDEGPKIRVKLFGIGEDLWDDTCTIDYIPNLGARTISEKDLELLQRYQPDGEYCLGGMDEKDDGEFVRWDSLIQLLK